MYQDVGFLDASVKLGSIITFWLEAGSGFNICMWPLCGVLIEYSFSIFDSSEECPGPCINHFLSAPVVFLPGETDFFLIITSVVLLGLVNWCRFSSISLPDMTVPVGIYPRKVLEGVCPS